MFAIYLLLGAGIFMGWSLGTNDGANAFGTAVATGVVKYRTAIIIIAIFVIIGAAWLGDGNINKLDELSQLNGVSATEEVVNAAKDTGSLSNLRLKSALKAAIIFVCSAVTVFIMSYLKFPVSANQATIGAIMGWGVCYIGFDNATVWSKNLAKLGEFALTWVACPAGAAVISFVITFLCNKFVVPRLSKLHHYDTVVKIGYLIAGAYAAFTIGQNSSASVTALYYDSVAGGEANLLGNARLAAIIGGIAIAVGVLTYSKKVMTTVGNSIAPLTQIEGFLVVISTALTIMLIGNIMQIPVSTSQATVGAVLGAGLTKGVKQINFGVFKNIAIAWLSSPLAAGLLSFLVGLATKFYFA